MNFFKGGSERATLLQKAKTNPHLTNINMDPSLSGSIKLILEGEGVKKIGVAGKSDIPLSGLGYLMNILFLKKSSQIYF